MYFSDGAPELQDADGPECETAFSTARTAKSSPSMIMLGIGAHGGRPR